MDNNLEWESLEPVPKLPHQEDPFFDAQLVGEPSDDVPDIFVFRDVLEELCYGAVYDVTRASASLLTGGWFVGPFGPYVEIDGFRDATPIDSVERYLHMLRSDRKSLRSRRSERILGCCLVVPGSNGRMGADELILLNTFFNRPYHVLLIVDGAGDTFGFYARDEAGRFHNAAVRVLSEKKAVAETLDHDGESVVGRMTSTSAEDTNHGSGAVADTELVAQTRNPESDPSASTAAEDTTEGEGHDRDR